MATAGQETKKTRIDGRVLNFANNTHIIGDVASGGSNPLYNYLKYGNVLFNGYVEQGLTPENQKILRILPRPIAIGTGSFPATITSYRSTFAVRNAYFWPQTGETYTYVIRTTPDGAIFRSGSGTAISTGLARFDPSGALDVQVGATEFYDGTNYYLVFGNATARPYYINTSNTVTQIADVDCPSGTGTSPYIVYMDGALFVAKNNSIHNSEFGSITNWPGYSRALEQYPNNILALAKHKNHIVAFTKYSMEFFYNAGYSGTSPLSRQESYASRVGLWSGTGIKNQKMFLEINDDIFFLSTNHETEIGVSKLSNFRLKKVSTPFIDQILKFSAANHCSISGFNHRGHTFICVQIYMSSVDASTTLVYDATEDFWSVWGQRLNSTPGTSTYAFSTGGPRINGFAYDYFTTDYNGVVSGFHAFSGEQHTIAQGSVVNSALGTNATPHFDYLSSSYPVDFLLRVSDIDFGSALNKHLKKVFILDLQNATSGTRPNISLYIYNNSYKNSTPTAITLPSYDDSMATNLSTGRKFVLEFQWDSGFWQSMNGLELHYNEGEQ